MQVLIYSVKTPPLAPPQWGGFNSPPPLEGRAGVGCSYTLFIQNNNTIQTKKTPPLTPPQGGELLLPPIEG
ncbi:hypothetical protein ULVI_02900 [Cochleicola gelatinilyticus]|uniref:Uncharacterized protein n=1 Tax=Cochleicola gelatinilyticus TaxID=1763537 RepID=A0A167IJ85_9FLAO|nr:hypothetical protein ULVI_02900 [Cochleicola gelatinilyticus]